MNGTQSLPKMCHPLIALFLLLFSLFTLTLSKTCNPYDQKILLEFKAQTGNSSSLHNWDPNTTDCCQGWNFIHDCDEQGHVTWLTLGGIGEDYSGIIPPIIGQLSYLGHLELWGPNVSGPIPCSIGNLTKLEYLAIQSTNMSGPIPNCFQRLSNLKEFIVALNDRVTGPIPDWLHKLPNLGTIDLSNNGLSGPIPNTLGSLQSKSSISLDIHGNRLRGPIPNSLGQLNTGWLDLSDNRLTGEPAFLYGRNNTLPFVNLSMNRLKFDASKMELPIALRGLNISHNMIRGSLPRQLGQLRLRYIDVSYNQLCGPIPTGRRLNQIDPVYFSHNKCLCGRPLPPCN